MLLRYVLRFIAAHLIFIMFYGGALISDLEDVERFQAGVCSGLRQEPRYMGNKECVKATIEACLVANNTCGETVELFYPPSENHWYVFCRNLERTKYWVNNVTRSITVPCFHKNGRGVTARISRKESGDVGLYTILSLWGLMAIAVTECY